MPEIVELQSLDHPLAAPYQNLTGRQMQQDHLFIAESENVIRAALEKGCRPLSLLMERRHIQGKGRSLAETCAVPILTGPDALLASLTGFSLSRGILCAMERPPETAAAAVVQNARRIAVLENVTDATNVGAIFRSAAALGMDGLLLTPSCCDPLQRRAARVSMGAVLRIPYAFCPAPLPFLKNNGFLTAALALTDHACSIQEQFLHTADKLALFLGAEGNGLAPETIAACHYAVIIPMHHQMNSLNVAAAAAIAFWELGKA